MDEVLSKTDQKIIMLAILCNPEGLNITKVDYHMLAEKGGYKTWDSARVKFGSAKRKLVKYAEECVAGAAGAKPVSPTGASAYKVTKKAGGGGGRKAGASPAKTNGTKTKGKKVKNEAVEEVKKDDTEEESFKVKAEQA